MSAKMYMEGKINYNYITPFHTKECSSDHEKCNNIIMFNRKCHQPKRHCLHKIHYSCNLGTDKQY